MSVSLKIDHDGDPAFRTQHDDKPVFQTPHDEDPIIQALSAALKMRLEMLDRLGQQDRKILALETEVTETRNRVLAAETRRDTSVVINGVKFVPVIPYLWEHFGVKVPLEKCPNGRTWISIVGKEFKAIAEECGRRVNLRNCIQRESHESSFVAWWYPEPWAFETAGKWVARNRHIPARRKWFSNLS